jgi:hypothetical protein
MLGNAGGAKGPDFWCAFEDGEVVVIGDEPANTINDRRRRRLLCRGAKESYSPCRSRARLVCLRVPCGEASRKAGCRKSARPVVCPAKAGMFSRGQTCRGKSQSPVVWIAEVMETETLKPIDEVFLGKAYESPGRNKSERIVASKMSIPEGRAFNRRAKAA